jgi:hypothetical protein
MELETKMYAINYRLWTVMGCHESITFMLLPLIIALEITDGFS